MLVVKKTNYKYKSVFIFYLILIRFLLQKTFTSTTSKRKSLDILLNDLSNLIVKQNDPRATRLSLSRSLLPQPLSAPLQLATRHTNFLFLPSWKRTISTQLCRLFLSRRNIAWMGGLARFRVAFSAGRRAGRQGGQRRIVFSNNSTLSHTLALTYLRLRFA